MKKVILYIAMSLDGYIADKDNSVDWLCGDGSNNQEEGSYDEFIKTIDTVIMGYTTYHQITNELAREKWPYQGLTTYVIKHHQCVSKDGIIFTNEKPNDLIIRLKKSDGKKGIWICGGASIVKQLIEFDLIDEYYVTLIPTILGKGTRLFNDGHKEIKLSLIEKYSYNGMVEIRYRKRK